MVATRLLKPLGTIDGTYIKIKGVAMGDDGTLINVKGGCLLVLIGTDGDANLLPLAVAHVRTESEETWRWFLNHCKAAFPELMDHPQLMMSMDGDKGAKAAVEGLLEQCGIVLCLKHRQRNIAAHFRGQAAVAEQCFAYFTKAAQCLDVDEFNEIMLDFERVCPDGYRYVTTRESETWATRMLKFITFGKLTSNDAESFNGMMASMKKFMPIPALIRMCLEIMVIRCYTPHMTKYLTTKRDGSYKYSGYFGPRMTKVFNMAVEKAQTLDVQRVGMTGGKVSSRSQLGRDHQVNTATPEDRASLCACLRPDCTGMVCSHLVALLAKIAADAAGSEDDDPPAPGTDPLDPRSYCDNSLTTAACRGVYQAANEVPLNLPGTTGAWAKKQANDGLLAPMYLLDNIKADRAKAREQAAAAPRAGMPARFGAGRGRRRGGIRGHGRIVSTGEREARAIQATLSQGARAGAPRGRYKCSICYDKGKGETRYDHTARNHATWAAGGHGLVDAAAARLGVHSLVTVNDGGPSSEAACARAPAPAAAAYPAGVPVPVRVRP